VADSTLVPPTSRPLSDRIKSGAAVLGAVAGTLTAVYGVYEKVRTEARTYTAASYNTLAPQINQMNDAVKQLQQENQQLRQIVADFQGKPRIGQTPPAARRPAPARRPTNVITPPNGPAATPAPAAGAPPAAPETTPTPPGAQPAPPAEAPADGDPVSGLLQTVGRTRAAIESLRKVPEDFEKVVKP
jgi:hypothetical protein